jgi:hypothetical protein
MFQQQLLLHCWDCWLRMVLNFLLLPLLLLLLLLVMLSCRMVLQE